MNPAPRWHRPPRASRHGAAASRGRRCGSRATRRGARLPDHHHMKALSASARRTPPAPVTDRGEHAHRRVTPSANVAPLVATAAQRRPPRRGAARPRRRRAGGRRGRVGPALVRTLSSSSPRRRTRLQRRVRTISIINTQEDVEGDPSSMRNGPRPWRERHQGDPVVDMSRPRSEDGRRRSPGRQKPMSIVATPTGTRTGARANEAPDPRCDEGHHDERCGGNERCRHV